MAWLASTVCCRKNECGLAVPLNFCSASLFALKWRVRWQCRRRAGSYKQLLQRDERRGMLGNVLEKMALEKAVMVCVNVTARVSM